ncbi:hypothetical protein [Nannocystis pusilla]|uniref:hypothetical protein n=1 Tax=Nannocystis pusilla TaxID=889268 RepID=UPI003BF235A4
MPDATCPFGAETPRARRDTLRHPDGPVRLLQPYAGRHTFRGWLLAADRAWYGLATATSRTAHGTLDAALADLTAFMLFDEELRATPFVRLLAVDHGVVHDIDLAPHVLLDNGQGRLTFADPAGCTALYVAGDPEVDPDFARPRAPRAAGGRHKLPWRATPPPANSHIHET